MKNLDYVQMRNEDIEDVEANKNVYNLVAVSLSKRSPITYGRHGENR